MIHRYQSHSVGSVAVAIAFGVAFSTACSDGEVNLGGGVLTQDVRQASRCAESPSIAGSVSVASQDELDELEGCEQIAGDLRVQIFDAADLSPLASLRAVGEALVLGDEGPFPTDPAEQEAYFARQAAGYLPSLHGLEALESAGRLQLDHLLVEDLTELGSLRSVGGGLLVNGSSKLRNFAGLEQVAFTDLWVSDSPALETLDGLRLRESSGGIVLQAVPALTNIDAIANVLVVNGVFMLSGVGVESLPTLSLQGATQLSIDNNPALVDASGLGALGGAIDLYVAANPKLRSFPALPVLLTVDSLSVVGNDSLEELALDFPGLAPRSRFLRDREVLGSVTQVEIGSNASLRRITAPAGFPAVQFFSIYANPSLTDVDLGTLARADLVLIDDNAALARVGAPNLVTVDALEIVGNPLLSTDAFSDVQTFTRDVHGNAASAP